MTSKISFSNLVRSEAKKLNWLLAVQVLVFGLLMPFKTLLVLAVRASEEVKYGYEWDIPEVFGELAGFNQFENTFFILAAGILCALAAFSYLHSAVKLDFYHSLAIKREQLFAVKVVSSSMTFVIPYVICQALTALIGLFYGAVNGTVVLEMLVDTIMGILYFLCSYAGALFAMMLTGKMVTTFLAMLTSAGYVPIAYVLFVGMEALFMSNSLSSMGYLSDRVLYHSSPWAFCVFGSSIVDGTKSGVTGRWPSLSYLCQLVAVIVILMLICVWLYGKRRTESAGSALAFRKTEGIVKVLLTVMAALGAAIVANEMMESLLWELVFIMLFGVLACVIMEFIYRADIRQSLSHKSHIVVTIVLAAGTFCFAKYDMTGYNSYVPEKDEIQSMAVKDNMTRIQYDLGNGYPEAYQTAFSKALLDYMETENFDKLYELAAEGAVFYDKEISYADVWRVGVKYHLKNGKEVYRAYWVNTDKYLEAMDELLKDPEFKAKVFPILTWNENMVKSMAASIWLPDSQIIELYQEVQRLSESDDLGEPDGSTGGEDSHKGSASNDTEQLSSETLASDELWRVVQAYKKDLEDLDYGDILGVSGELNFHWNEKDNCYYGDYPLNITFENTVEVLAEVFAS